MKKVLVIAPNGFEELELAPFTDILGWTRIVEGVHPVRYWCSLSRSVVFVHMLAVEHST
ncbi:MAG: hypothetical protein ACE5IQ_06870 [Candidatus Methylomirabilales bacterium]